MSQYVTVICVMTASNLRIRSFELVEMYLVVLFKYDRSLHKVRTEDAKMKAPFVFYQCKLSYLLR